MLRIPLFFLSGVATLISVPANAQPRQRDKRDSHLAINAKLLEASERGDTAEVKGLLTKGANPNIRGKFGWSPLLLATQSGSVETAKMLLRSSANPNAYGNEGETALWAAVDNLEMVQLLLKHGAKPSAPKPIRHSALQFAAELGRLQVVRLLVTSGADITSEGPGALGQAVFKGHSEVVRYLISKGVPVNSARWNVNYKSREDSGWSLLMVATKRGHVDVAKLLIEGGARLHVRSKLGLTALKVAQLYRDPEIEELLKHSGAKR